MGQEGLGQDQDELDRVAEQQTQENKAKEEQIAQFDNFMVSAKELDESDASTQRFAEMAEAIDSSPALNDAEKIQYLDQLMGFAEGVKENARSERMKLVRELSIDNDDIHENANINEIALFVDDPSMEKIFKEFTQIELPESLDSPSLRMTIWEQMMPVVQLMSETEVDAVTLDLKDLNFNPDSQLDAVGDMLAKTYGQEVSETFQTQYKQVLVWISNIQSLEKTTELQDVDMDRLDISQYVMWIEDTLSPNNQAEHVKKVLELSKTEFDQDAAVESLIQETNKIDPERIRSFAEVRDANGQAIADVLIKMENEWWLGSMMSDFISKSLKEWGILAAIIKLFFWDKFAEAFAEGNVKKQKALMNLVEFSEEGSNPLSAKDFSKVSWDDLEWFFKSMDSHKINYGQKDFWKHFITGKDASKSMTQFRRDLQKTDPDFFEFKDTDFDSIEPSKSEFLKKLNAIPVKPEPKEGETTEWEWQSEAVSDSTLNTSDGTPVQSGTPDQPIRVVPPITPVPNKKDAANDAISHRDAV